MKELIFYEKGDFDFMIIGEIMMKKKKCI